MKKLIFIAILGIVATACSTDTEVTNININNIYTKQIPTGKAGAVIIAQPWIDSTSTGG